MTVEPEVDNRYDPYAMIIKMPDLLNIPSKYHEEVISCSGQRVQDISGKTVGRVPANVCKLFRKLIEQKYALSITCFSLEKPSHSKSPDFAQSYQRKRGKHDRPGGGCVIPCKFEVECNERVKVFAIINDALKDLKGTEKIEHND